MINIPLIWFIVYQIKFNNLTIIVLCFRKNKNPWKKLKNSLKFMGYFLKRSAWSNGVPKNIKYGFII